MKTSASATSGGVLSGRDKESYSSASRSAILIVNIMLFTFLPNMVPICGNYYF